MSLRHRVDTAVHDGERRLMYVYGPSSIGATKLVEIGDMAHVVVVDDYAAKVWAAMLAQVFRSQRHQVIHNGRKPRVRQY